MRPFSLVLARVNRMKGAAVAGLSGLGLSVDRIGDLTALERAALKHVEAYDALAEFEFINTVFHRSGLPATQQLALMELERTTEVLRSLLSKKEFAAAAAQLERHRTILTEGFESVLELTDDQIKNLERMRAAVQRELSQEQLEEIDQTMKYVMREMRDVATGARLIAMDVAGAGPSATVMTMLERKALATFMEEFNLTDEVFLRELGQKLQMPRLTPERAKRIMSLEPKPNQFVAKELKELQGFARYLKGYLLERWFWDSAIWTEWSSTVMQDAIRLAKQLGDTGAASRFGGKLVPKVIHEPSRLLSTNREIWDGVVCAVAETKPGFFQGYISALVQIKSEKVITVFKQIGKKDIPRELGEGAVIKITVGPDVYVFHPRPDNLDPLRLIVAPEMPRSKKQWESIAKVADVRAAPTLVTPQEMDLIALIMLRARARQLFEAGTTAMKP